MVFTVPGQPPPPCPHPPCLGKKLRETWNSIDDKRQSSCARSMRICLGIIRESIEIRAWQYLREGYPIIGVF